MTATVEKAKKLLVPNGAQSLKKTTSSSKDKQVDDLKRKAAKKEKHQTKKAKKEARAKITADLKSCIKELKAACDELNFRKDLLVESVSKTLDMALATMREIEVFEEKYGEK
ncbi:hypothetical protein N7474_001015 [Penicillium riverlandense]|uniref:uncharacterized protein n=1 Tax=Penicillium riverlandense TaxID=1903569 RepID=UPI002549A9AE|nr:uncharacterized protein N7474_001015 [Penicillium riverlandense]KAJ5832704.1 hypothetical protein N7474_001015 [Penicillium riverlandense]